MDTSGLDLMMQFLLMLNLTGGLLKPKKTKLHKTNMTNKKTNSKPFTSVFYMNSEVQWPKMNYTNTKGKKRLENIKKSKFIKRLTFPFYWLYVNKLYIKTPKPVKKVIKKSHIVLRYSTVFGLILLIVVTPLLTLIRTRETQAWWDDVWTYRKPIVITAGSSAASDFQVKVTVDTATLITNNKLQSDCDDLRFVSPSLKNLDYWIEEDDPGCNNASTEIWVEVDSLPGTGTTTIYMYYGNPGAIEKSSGSDTFPFFDDFNDDNIDGWTATGGTSLSSGELTITTGAVWDFTGMYSSEPYMYEYRNKWTTTTGSYSGMIINDSSSATGGNGESDKLVYYMTGSGATYDVFSYAADGTAASYNIQGGATQYTASASTWNLDGFALDGTNVRYFHNRSQTNSYTGNWDDYVYLWFGYFYGSTSSTTDIKDLVVDWVLARRYMATEPSAASAGTEEVTDSPVAYYSFNEGYGTTVHNQMEKNGEEGLLTYFKFDDASSGTSPAPQDEMGINHGTWGGSSNYTSTYSHTGYAADFDGYTSDYVSIPDSSMYDFGTGPFTWSFWFRKTYENDCAALTWKNADQSDDTGVTLRDDETMDVRFEVDSVVNYAVTNGGQYSLNAWHHAVIVRDSDGNVNTYIDGEPDGSGTDTTDLNSMDASTPIWLGSNHANYVPAVELSGQLDEVKIYNRALSAEEVSVQYNSMHGHMINMDPSTDWVDGAQPNPNQEPLGSALDFDGSNDQAHVASVYGLSNTDLTISTWVNLPDTSESGAFVKIGSEDVSDNDGYAIGVGASDYDGDGNDFIMLYEGVRWIDTGVTIGTGWHHVAMTIDNSGVPEGFIDGESIGTFSGTNANAPESDDSTKIGGYTSSASTNRFGTYTLDETKIYKKALSDDQIKVQYNRGVAQGFGVGQGDTGNPPVGFWKLDESSAYTAFDSSGNNNNGELINMDPGNDWVQGRVGGGLDFDGSNDYILVSDSSSLDVTNITVSAWIKRNATGQFDYIVTKDSTDTGSAWELEIDSSDKIHFEATTNGQASNYRYCKGITSLNTDWHHVSAVYDGTYVYLYLDGNLDKKGQLGSSGCDSGTLFTGNLYTTNEPLHIAMVDYGGAKTYTSSIIDHVKIYDYARSSEQIHYDMATGSPIAYWDFNEGYGTTVRNREEITNDNGLVSYYKFDDASSGTSPPPQDEMGINDCTWNGTSNYDPNSHVGYAAELGGTATDYIDCGTDSSFDIPDGTISTWFYLDDYSTDHQDIMGKFVTPGSTGRLSISIEDSDDPSGNYNKPSLWITNEAVSSVTIWGDSAVSTDTWTHIAVTFGNSGMKMYIDGIEQADTDPLTVGMEDADANLTIGVQQPAGYAPFAGEIDEFKVYRRILSAEEIEAEYKSMHGHMVNMDPNADWVDGAQVNSNQKPMGRALDFDGSSDFVDAGEEIDLANKSFTVSSWAKRGSSGNHHYIAGLGSSGSAGNSLHFGFRDTNVFTCAFYSYDLDTTDTYTDNDWHHWACTYNAISNARKIYRDGVEVASDTATADFAGSGHFYIGRRGWLASGYFDGSIDETKVFNYTLTENEVKIDYNRGKALVLGAGESDSDPGTANLVGWWKMDEAGTYTAFDSSGNDNNGELISMNPGNDWVQGRVGGGLDFDGSNDYVELYDGKITTSTLGTIALWVKIDTLENADKIIGYGGGDVTTPGLLGLEIRQEADSSYHFGVIERDDSGSISSIIGDTNPQEGIWYHLALTSNGSAWKIYVNGIEETLSSHTTIDVDGNNGDWFGDVSVAETDKTTLGAIMYDGSIAGYLDGKIDHVKIWSDALTQSEIAFEYSQGKPIYHYKFNEDEGVIVKNAETKSVSTEGLTGFWAMDTSGTSDIIDRSGHGNDLSVSDDGTHPTNIAGPRGLAVDLEASNSQYYSVADTNNLDYQGNGLTVSAWIKADSNPGVVYIVSKLFWNDFGDNGGYELLDDDGTLCFAGWNDSDGGMACSDIASSTSNWQHIAGTYDGSYLKVYIDGNLEATTYQPDGIMNVSDEFDIGRNPNMDGYWDGKIDHVKVYQRALNSNEVWTEYAYDDKFGFLTNMDPATDWVTGKYGSGALDFDGTDDYIEQDDRPIVSFGDGSDDQPFSVSSWVNMDDATSFIVFHKGDKSGTTPHEWYFGTEGNDKIRLRLYDSASGQATMETSDLAITSYENQWAHIAATYDGSESNSGITLYLNGNEVTSTGSVSGSYTAMHSTDEPLFIGAFMPDNVTWKLFADGEIDEAKIYNYELTADQVKVDMNNGKAARL
ncbi:DUF2341 domain-containing protein [Patescibacteria group bacterium]